MLNDHNNVEVKLYLKAKSMIGSKDMTLKKEKNSFSKFDYLNTIYIEQCSLIQMILDNFI